MGRTGRLRKRKAAKIVNVSNDVVYLNLHNWLKNHGFSGQPPLKPAIFPLTGRGLQACKTIQEGEVVVTIPVSALITRDLVLHSTLPFHQLQSISHLSTQTLLSVWLLTESSKGSSSSYYPYLQSLPKCYSTIYFCSSEEKMLLPQYLRFRVADQYDTISTNYTSLVSRGFKTSRASFEWAWFTVNTRAVYLSRDPRFARRNKSVSELEDSGECLALAPYLDLLNHTFDAVMEAGVDIHKSTTFINYGPHDNTKLLLEYGFFLPNNPHEGFNLTVAAICDFLDDSGLEISELSRKVDILKSNRLDQNMCVTSEGVSWNTLMCLKVLLMSRDALDLWHLIFHDSEDDGKMKKILVDLLSFLITDLNVSLEKLKQLLGSCSDSFSLCVDLVASHERILQQAKLSI